MTPEFWAIVRQNFLKLPLVLTCILLLSSCGGDQARDPYPSIGVLLNAPTAINTFSKYYVSAEGAWAIDGEKSASPHNIAKIFCSREEMVCDTSYADINPSGDIAFLNLETNTYPITQWDDEKLVAVSDDENCRRSSFEFDARAKTVTQTITENRDGKFCIDKEGEMIPIMERPRVIRLLTGDQWKARMRKDYDHPYY